MKIEKSQIIYQDEMDEILVRASQTKNIKFYIYVRSLLKCGGESQFYPYDGFLQHLVNIHGEPEPISDELLEEGLGSRNGSWTEALFHSFIVLKLEQGVSPFQLHQVYGIDAADYKGLSTERDYVPLKETIA